MKKVILFLSITISLLFISCSDDDTTSDPFIGQWKLQSITFNGNSIDLGCDAEGILEVKSDGTFTVEDYEEDVNDNCVLDEIINGEWSNEGNSNYSISSQGEESDIFQITFEGNIFSISDEDGTTIYQRI